jgi:hypothetical protein
MKESSYLLYAAHWSSDGVNDWLTSTDIAYMNHREKHI